MVASALPTPPTTAPGRTPGMLRRAWVRLAGESDPIERQLAATAREGATLARVAHACAFLMLLLFSLGSLIALAGDSVAAIAAGHITIPAIIAAGVSTLLVACMDTGMLYAASMLRLLAARRASKEEGRLHRFVLFSVAILEAATYGYMSYRYEAPHDGIAWALIIARALAAPLLSVYLSLARPLPVTARDMLALGERIAGEGVLRDLARIAGDASAPLADKVALYIAAAVISPADRSRLEAMLDVAQRRETVKDTSAAIETPPASATLHTAPSSKPPTGGGTPRKQSRVITPAQSDGGSDAGNVVRLPSANSRPRKRKSASNRAPRLSVEDKARAAFTPGMSGAALAREAHIGKSAASKWRHVLQVEAEQAIEQAAQ